MEHIPFIFPFLFVGMWILVAYVISKMGWADLVAHYETDATFEGKRIGIISASVNSANYNNSLVMKYNEDGIYLRPVLLFRMFHKPILIPWKEIKEVRDKKILFFAYKLLVVGNPFVATIGLRKITFVEIEGIYLRTL